MSDAVFDNLARAVRDISGLELSPTQGYLLSSRLAPLLRDRRLAGLEDLARRLATPEGPLLAREMAEALTTNETSFFRDDAPFRHLTDQTLPELDRARSPGQPLRVWSAACSSGQEAYSVAIAAAEMRLSRPLEILGTDLSGAMVERARAARYSAFEVQRGLPPELLARWFRADGDGWRVSDDLRRRCRFQVANLLHDLSALGTFDVVLLRNVLLYFDPPTKERVVAACARRMQKDGVLYLGATETLIGLRTPLLPLPGWRGAWRLA